LNWWANSLGDLGLPWLHGRTSALMVRSGFARRNTVIALWTPSGDPYSQNVEGTHIYGGRTDGIPKTATGNIRRSKLRSSTQRRLP
jgi:hypothetical protein